MTKKLSLTELADKQQKRTLANARTAMRLAGSSMHSISVSVPVHLMDRLNRLANTAGIDVFDYIIRALDDLATYSEQANAELDTPAAVPGEVSLAESRRQTVEGMKQHLAAEAARAEARAAERAATPEPEHPSLTRQRSMEAFYRHVMGE
jgi:predicted RNA-binding Zn ribbon-like protein